MADNANRYIIGQMEKLENLTGTLSSPSTLNGVLSNATLRGAKVELRINGTMLQWKHEDEDVWRDLIDINEIDYNELMNLPTIDGIKFSGDMTNYIITPQDELSNTEVQRILNS